MEMMKHFVKTVAASVIFIGFVALHLAKLDCIEMKHDTAKRVKSTGKYDNYTTQQMTIVENIKLGSSVSAYKMYIYDLPPAFNEDI